MGKAKIVSEQGDGKYTIKLDFGTELRDERVGKLAARLAEIELQITEAKAKLQAAKAKEAQRKIEVEQATADYIAATQAVPIAFSAVSAAGAQVASISASPTATPEQMQAAKAALAAAEAQYKAAQEDVKTTMAAQVDAAKKLVEAKKETAPLQLALDVLKDEKAQLKKDKAYLEGLALDETTQVWCADLTEDAEGEVATIEIPGENALVLIKAGAEPGGTVDGKLAARELQSPAQVFFNAAILPGWQKWQPTYRRGVITSLDFEADTANVQLDDDKSSAQKLDINQTKTLEAVPVIYMGCHAMAFEVGDKCVVRFDEMDWKKPQVVGFVDNPKACPGGIGIEVASGMFILRPPKEGGGHWKAREANELNGGLAYATKGGSTFVDGKNGLFRSNKRAGSALFGGDFLMHQLKARVAFPVSGLFVSNGFVQQLKAREDDSLRYRGLLIKGIDVDTPLQESSTSLPAVTDGDNWDMVSASQDGEKFIVCRVAKEDGVQNGTRVCAVAHYTAQAAVAPSKGDPPSPRLLELSAVNTLPYNVIAKAPNGADYSAPEWAEFTHRTSYVTVVLQEGSTDFGYANGNIVRAVCDPPSISKSDFLKTYTENSDFKEAATYRTYIAHDGGLVSEEVERTNVVDINNYSSSSNIGSSRYIYPGYWYSAGHVFESDQGREVLVSCSEKIKFFGSREVTTYNTKIKYNGIEQYNSSTILLNPDKCRTYAKPIEIFGLRSS